MSCAGNCTLAIDKAKRSIGAKKLFEKLLNDPSRIIPPTHVNWPRADPSYFAVHVSPVAIPVELQKVLHPETNLQMFSQLLLKRQLLVLSAVLLLFGKSLVQFRIDNVGSTGSLQPLTKSPEHLW